MKAFLILMIVMLWPGAADAAQVSRQIDSMGREYYLFTPDKVDPAVTYWLVVEGHGYGGKGSPRSGARAWADRGDCIGVAPSFPNDGYQMLGQNADQQLIQIFQKLRKDFKLHDKLFVYGHSGGAQFAHRFALKYPQLVAGCCATSGGTWSTGREFGTVTDMAASVPIAISCGERDAALSVPGSPMTRIVWARKFEEELGNRRFFYKAVYWPNAGHEGDGPGNAELANEAFSLGTSGMVGKDRADFDAKMKVVNDLVRGGEFGRAMIDGGYLRQQMKRRTEKQTADNLASANWHAGSLGISACERTTQEFVAWRMWELSCEIENAALDQVATLSKEAAPDAMPKLRALYNTFAGWVKVRTAITQAAARLQAKVQ